MTLLETIGIAAVTLHALLSAIYKSMQAFYARKASGSQPRSKDIDPAALPSVDIIVPCFNEDPAILSACLSSLAGQDYGGKLRIYMVDDGSCNREAILPVHDFYTSDPRFEFLLLSKNFGKRKAQIAAIERSCGDLILNVDSDTSIASDVVTLLVEKMRDSDVGAAMGQLKASNRDKNLLTRLIDMEYWLACNDERAAQARFGAVMCCCGPCAMYRRSALLLLLDQYQTQLYRGKPSDFGEDRHLTILMLSAGFRTEYVPEAIAKTVVPDRMGSYLRQQLRWARSTFRDTLLALPLLPSHNRFLTLDAIHQNIGPLLLAVSSATGITQFILTATVPGWTIIIIASMTMVRCSVAAYRARQIRFLAFSLHTLINLFMLIPLKGFALLTLSNSDWLSRGSTTDGPAIAESNAASNEAEIVASESPFGGGTSWRFRR
ncbi:chitooligosaccharide synthase NodC [Neorhizobium galegae]|uniref:chitooligosaccharide synthase NodC n=1 Tax=Neorhizobium galegae TaxID=399 RepID=UPI0006225271|nr:chitooligosaccharide synthase NodC [Neorhizobium galegae]CDZ64832.1 N-acetylglucosaminyltransferase NodC [Neorhizobium galegae bv. orientalis]KAB1119810.1 chitooligosaccharide synthase NodC [Neorhizobium galegae]MCQ1575116.1 chitooligosaccharide synthase NodC [Neorhizobium galegae]MCQ1810845.1 chitooligosaccharide synthase NodC [Neorhizobium galegae]MCQ1839186.1 chitooligosaccharide synthase NodC [Neorhizobium galegae]